MKKLANNKKGFSLIELIIVIAIMVALIAVMAPNFVKYVQKSRDTALSTAAEDFYSSVKVAYGDPDSVYSLPTTGMTYTITIFVDGNGKLNINKGGNLDQTDLDKLIAASGADTAKKMGKTNDIYTITITPGPTFKMAGATRTSTGA